MVLISINSATSLTFRLTNYTLSSFLFPPPSRDVLKGGPVLVPGLSRFLDNRDRAKRLEVEQKEREDRAFWARAAELPAKASPTVPEPFRLSSEVRGGETMFRTCLSIHYILGILLDAQNTLRDLTSFYKHSISLILLV